MWKYSWLITIVMLPQNFMKMFDKYLFLRFSLHNNKLCFGRSLNTYLYSCGRSEVITLVMVVSGTSAVAEKKALLLRVAGEQAT